MDLDHLEEWHFIRFSWDHNRLPPATHWFLMARAYLDCSYYLFGEMIQERVGNSFHHAKVAAGLFEHALELFLKGAIVQAHAPVPTHHRAADLLREYRRLYPGKEYEFVGKVDEAASEQRNAPRNQFTRYPGDQKGRLWEGNTHIDLVIWYKELRSFKADFERLEPLIRAMYP